MGRSCARRYWELAGEPAAAGEQAPAAAAVVGEILIGLATDPTWILGVAAGFSRYTASPARGIKDVYRGQPLKLSMVGDLGRPRQARLGQIAAEVKSVQLSRIPSSAEIVYHSEGYIYSMDRDGQHATQLTFGPARPYEHVAASNDRRYVVGNEILMTSAGQPRSLLWLYDLQAGTERRLAPSFHSAGDGGVDWDPRGFVYFSGRQRPMDPSAGMANLGGSDLYRIRFDGTGLQQLTDTPDAGEVDVGVSDNGRLLAYVKELFSRTTGATYTELWVINTDGSNPRLVYRAGQSLVESAHDPEPSPDGTQLTFSQVNPAFRNWPAIAGLNTAHDIWVIGLNGTGRRRVTPPGPISIAPSWHGDTILYSELNEKDGYKGAVVIQSDGTGYKRIRSGTASPKWIHGSALAVPTDGIAAAQYQGALVELDRQTRAYNQAISDKDFRRAEISRTLVEAAQQRVNDARIATGTVAAATPSSFIPALPPWLAPVLYSPWTWAAVGAVVFMLAAAPAQVRGRGRR